MKILITGANGFVGGYQAAMLAAEGDEVFLTDLAETLMRDPAPSEPSLPYSVCDLRSGEQVDAMLRSIAPDAIIHLAAQSSAAISFADPRKTFEVNVIGTLNLLEGARSYLPGTRMLLTGSCEEYGRKEPSRMPLSEEAIIEPVSPYAASKAAQGTMALQYHRAFGSRVVVTRSFSHTGPGQADRFVLPSFARQCAAVAADGGPKVIKTGNLDVVRDFLDVRDVVRAYSALLKKGEEGAIYNVCSGEGLNLGAALEVLCEMAGTDIEVEKDPALLRPVDVPVLVGDNSRLVSDTGWSRTISTESMLADLFAWWMDRLESGEDG